MLTIPAEALDCVMFLAVSDGEKLHFGGTAFVASVSGPEGQYFPYLVTARHNIELAKRREGRLVARYNVQGGNAILDLSGSEVLMPDEAGVDVALIADLDWDAVVGGGRVRHLSLDDMAASAEFVKDNDIGIGTEVFATGLFAARRGEGQNLPVGRTGTIAAMPIELDKDEWSGEPYLAYLVEMRSLGGLSGSPVYVMTPPKFAKSNGEDWHLDQQLRLLGLIRGHWNYDPETTAVDFEKSEAEMLHSGIAIVTPVDDVLKLLDREDLREDRVRRTRARR
jgi:hypothetical protein